MCAAFCDNCGASFSQDARFCASCGAKRQQAADAFAGGQVVRQSASYVASSPAAVIGIDQGPQVVRQSASSYVASAPNGVLGVESGQSALFNALDQNHDGVITRSEFAAAAGGVGGSSYSRVSRGSVAQAGIVTPSGLQGGEGLSGSIVAGSSLAPPYNAVDGGIISARAGIAAPVGGAGLLSAGGTVVSAPAPVGGVLESNQVRGFAGGGINSSATLYSRLFMHLDADGDGVLSAEEMQAAQQLLRSAGNAGPIMASCLEVADLDKDGLVSMEDWQGYTSKCDLGSAVIQGVTELLQQLDSVPAGWRRLPMPGRHGQLGFYCKDLDIWAGDAHLIDTFPGKCRVFDNLLTKLGKMGKGVVSGLQMQAVCAALQQQGGVGAFLSQQLQQADTNRDGCIDRRDWIRHFININVSEQELNLIDEAIGVLDATELDDLTLSGLRGGSLPYGWEKQESSSRPGVFYYVHTSLNLGSRLQSLRQVLEVEQALAIFDRLFQVFGGGGGGIDRVFTPAMISQAATTLPQVGSAGVMLMQILNTADLDRDGNVSRADWANYFIQVGIPTNSLNELEQGASELWRSQRSSGGGFPSAAAAAAPTVGISAPTAMVLPQQQQPPPQQVNAPRGDLFDLLDRNRDGVVTRGEFSAAAGADNLRGSVYGGQGGVDRPARPSMADMPPEGPRIMPREY